jgi:hypothetical protein
METEKNNKDEQGEVKEKGKAETEKKKKKIRESDMIKLLKEHDIDPASMTKAQRTAAFSTNQPMLWFGTGWRDDIELTDVRMFTYLVGHFFHHVWKMKVMHPRSAYDTLVAAAQLHKSTKILVGKKKNIPPLTFHYKNFSEEEKEMPPYCLEGIAIASSSAPPPASPAVPSLPSAPSAPAPAPSVTDTPEPSDDFPTDPSLRYPPFQIPPVLQVGFKGVARFKPLAASTIAADAARTEELEWKHESLRLLMSDIKEAQALHPVHNSKIGTTLILEEALAQRIKIFRELMEIRSRARKYVPTKK